MRIAQVEVLAAGAAAIPRVPAPPGINIDGSRMPNSCTRWSGRHEIVTSPPSPDRGRHPRRAFLDLPTRRQVSLHVSACPA